MFTKQECSGKKVAVFGIGKSGRAAIEFLLNSNINTLVWDDNQSVLSEIKEKYQSKCLSVQDYKSYDWSEINYLILAAGVPLTHPHPHDVVKTARENDCPIISDVEFLYKSFPNNTYIGITGTNGKSTTTALTGHIFEKAGVKSCFGGNLGNRAALALEKFKKDGVYIIEMSSYMLDLSDELRFNIAVLLNITPDHFKRHGNLEGYIDAKKRIFLNQDENCFAIISIDNENSKRIYEELKSDKNYKGKLIPVSFNKIIKNGLSLVNGTIHNYLGGKNESVVLGEMQYLRGQHNAENIICAYAAAMLYGIDSEEIIEYIKEFKGLDHRMQFIRKIDNINFINDSKATNDTSTEQALKANDNIYWILGGRPKPGGINLLKKYFDKVIYAFLIGEATEEFAETLEQGGVKYFKCGDLENAFNKAYDTAKKEDKAREINILLSPACASFDQWKSFEKRGEYFVKLTNELKE